MRRAWHYLDLAIELLLIALLLVPVLIVFAGIFFAKMIAKSIGAKFDDS